jgi:hypothetical protein
MLRVADVKSVSVVVGSCVQTHIAAADFVVNGDPACAVPL